MDLARLYAELRRDEKVSRALYIDDDDIPRIGVHHNCLKAPLPRGYDSPLTARQVLAVLAWDVDDLIAELNRRMPWWTQLDEVRQRAVANMAFSLDVAGMIKCRHLVTAIRRKQWDEAAACIARCRWAKKVGPVRSGRLAQMLRSGLEPYE